MNSLIENAAKSIVLKSNEDSVGRIWDPLNNSGDAFELAARLKLFMEIGSESRGFVVVRTNDSNFVEFREHYDTDSIAALRKAIVRTAAYIGEQVILI